MINQTALQAPSDGDNTSSTLADDDSNCVNRLGSSDKSVSEFLYIHLDTNMFLVL